jgi:FAD/FMN-containing dehydrogenase
LNHIEYRPPAAGHSPAGNRDARFILNVAGAWETPDADAANIAWTRETWESMRQFGTGGVYLNFLSEDEDAERTKAAFGADLYQRLVALKARYDPTNLFRHTKQLGG